MQGEQPFFGRVQNHQNHFLLESYCLICCKFIGAGRSEFHLGLVEFAHRTVCKWIDQDITKEDQDITKENDDESRTGVNP